MRLLSPHRLILVGIAALFCFAGVSAHAQVNPQTNIRWPDCIGAATVYDIPTAQCVVNGVAAGVSTAQGVPPIEVNGDNAVHSGAIQISCGAGGCASFQPSTPDPNGTQSTLIYFTPSSGVAQGPGGPSLTFTFPGLPSCVSAVNVTDAYIYVTSSGYVPNGLPTDFSVFNSGGGTTTNTGPGQFIPPGGGSGGIGGQPQWSTSTVGTHFTVLPTNYTAVTVGLTTSSLGALSDVAVSNVVMRVYYTGTACPAQAAVNLNPPLSFDPVHQAIFLSSPFGNAIDFGAVNVYTANVSLLDSTNGGHPVPGDSVKLFVSNANTSTTPTLAITNSSDTAGFTIVNAPPTGSSTTTALSVGQLQVGIPYTLTLDQGGKWEIGGGSSSGSGSVTDGGGTTTPNQIATSTSTAHQIQYGTALPSGTTATTQTTGDNTAKVATDAFVIANAAGAGCSGATCVQYNPTSTANIFLSFSGLYDDLHAISGTAIPVTSVATSGSVTTVTTTSAHGLIAGNAVEVDTITGWPCSGQSAQCGSFQIIATGLTSTQFEFDNNGHTLTCSSSCGNVWNASFWAIWETASQPFFSGHGTVYGVEQTLAAVAGAFSTYVNCSLGAPTNLIIEAGQDDLAAGASVATIKGYLQTIWQAAHAAGCIVAQGTLTGADYGGSPSSSVFSGMEALNVWIPTQTATATSNGSNWDIPIDYGLFLGTRGGGNYTLGETEAASHQFAVYTNQALANQSGNMTGPPPITGQGDRLTGTLHYDAAYGVQYWNDGDNLFWMLWGCCGNNGNYIGVQNNFPRNGATYELMQNGNVGEFNHICIGSNALPNGPHSFSSGNAFCWNFNYVSSGSNSNYMGLGPIGGTDNIRLFPNGDVQFPALTGLPGSGTSVVCVDTSGNVVVGGCGTGTTLDANTVNTPQYAVSGGSANAQTLTLSPSITSLSAGLHVRWKPGFTNTGAMTLAISGLSAVNVTKCGTTALASGDVLTGAVAEGTYDGTEIQLVNPQAVACAAGSPGVTSITATSPLVASASTGAVTLSCPSCGGGSGGFPLTVIQSEPVLLGVGSSGTTFTYTFPQALQSSGATAILIIGEDASSTFVTPVGWTCMINVSSGTNFPRLVVCLKASAGDTTVALVSGNPVSPSLQFYEVTGSHAFDITSGTGFASGSPAIVAFPSIAPTAGAAVFFAATYVDNSTTSPATVAIGDPNWTTINLSAFDGAHQRKVLGGVYLHPGAGVSILPPPMSILGGAFSSSGVAYATFSIL